MNENKAPSVRLDATLGGVAALAAASLLWFAREPIAVWAVLSFLALSAWIARRHRGAADLWLACGALSLGAVSAVSGVAAILLVGWQWELLLSITLFVSLLGTVLLLMVALGRALPLKGIRLAGVTIALVFAIFAGSCSLTFATDYGPFALSLGGYIALSIESGRFLLAGVLDMAAAVLLYSHLFGRRIVEKRELISLRPNLGEK